MGIWIELRCEGRGGYTERPRELVCWSDENNDPGDMADDNAASLRATYAWVKQAAQKAGWKLVRGGGWFCPCCLASGADKAVPDERREAD